MVSPNTAVAAASSSTRTKGCRTHGFDIVADRLTQTMHDQFKTDTKKTSIGVVNTAHKSLRSAFAESLKGVKKTQSVPSAHAISPSTSTTRSLRYSTSFSTTSTSPLSSFPPQTNHEEDELSPNNRFDTLTTPRSSTNRCAKRLRIGEIIRLGYHNEFTVFIPSFENKNESKHIRSAREQTMATFRSIITDDVPKSWSSAQKAQYFQSHLKTREVMREGRVGHEFNVRLQYYPERARMDTDPLPESEANYILNPSTGVGLNCELLGYGPARLALIKVTNLPFIEIYVPRNADDAIISEVKFPRSSDDDVLAGFMAREFLETKGDPIAYTNILLSYYKLKQSKSTATERQMKSDIEIRNETMLNDALQSEVDKSQLDSFSAEVEKFYKTAIEGSIDFTAACKYLVSDEVVAWFYHVFKSKFPSVHKVLCSIVESETYTEPPLPEEFDFTLTGPLHKKQRMMLFIFYASLRMAPAATTGGAETVGACVRRSSPLLDDVGSTSCTSDGSFAFDWLARDTTSGEMNGGGMMRVMDGLSIGEPASVRHRLERPS